MSTLDIFRRMSRRAQAPQALPSAAPWPEMPPGPQQPQLREPDFIPWSHAMSGFLDAEFDPCGPVKGTRRHP